MFSLESFHIKYATDLSNLKIHGREFSFYTPKTLDLFMDPDDVFNNFPLWAKIWEAAIVLSEYLAGIPPEPGKRFLEIGGGMGIAGIVASSFGHYVTVTEYNTDALNFARANAEKNLPSQHANLEIVKLDWNKPNLKGLFDIIFASEIIYNDRDYQPILGIFKKFLKPGGEIILAERVRKTSIEFFKQVSDIFDIKAQKKILRSSEGEIMVMLCRMKYR
jgi:predicted nicotinamide N-methyase